MGKTTREVFAPNGGADSLPVPEEAVAAIRALEDAGFESWVVGGFVRDSLLGAKAADVDIATQARWTQAQEVFEERGWRTHETGTAHGTLTVIVGDRAMEVTTFRADGPYEDGRHPSRVDFVSTIDEDLARRDFTVNALAYHPARGLRDPFGGLDDLQKGVIRTVGEPQKRFSEDALRILRACRFVAQLGFSIEERTYRGMCMGKGMLGLISMERIRHELNVLLTSPHAGKAIMETADVLSAVLPELVAMKGFDQHTPHHIYDVLEHTAHVVDGVPATELLRWAALFHDMGKPAAFFFDENERGHFKGHPMISAQLADGVMRRLGMSRSFANRVLELVRRHDQPIEASHRAVRRTLMSLDGDVDLTRGLFELKRADALAQAPSSMGRLELAEELLEILDEVVAEGEAFSMGDLAVTGRDVMELGVPEGPLVGRALEEALDAVVDGRVENDEAALKAFLAEWSEGHRS